jgi:hypothetical protein
VPGKETRTGPTLPALALAVPAAGAAQEAPGARFRRIEAKGERALQFSKIEAARARRPARMDADGDGALTSAELRALRRRGDGLPGRGRVSAGQEEKRAAVGEGVADGRSTGEIMLVNMARRPIRNNAGPRSENPFTGGPSRPQMLCESM